MKVKETSIVFLTSGHSPFSSRLFYKELRSLKKINNNLLIIAPYNKKEEIKEDIRIIGIKKYKSRYKRWSTLSALYKKASEIHPDIIHCHEPDSLLVSYLLKKKLANIKVIYDCHEFHPYSFPENYPYLIRNLAKKIIEKFENFLSSRVDSIITVNQRLANKFRKYNESVIELPNYPPLDTVAENRERRELFSSPEIRLVYAGGLSKDRGIFRMLKVIREIKKNYPIKLMLIGKFDSIAQKKRFFSDVDKYQLNNNINYIGYLSHKQTILNLMKADIGLFLASGKDRYKWSEPIKYFEYSAVGLPVIMSDFPATRALVEKNKNGILVPGDSVEDAAKSVTFLIENKKEAKRMGENGRKAFREKYNWELIEPRLFNLYNKLS